LEGAPTSEIRDFIEFTTRVGLPTTLTEAGLRADDKDSLRKVADAATAEGETIHSMPFEVHADDVVSALASIERFAVHVRDDAKLPAPVPHVAHH
jgi:glycerol dehydrogenase